jgi:hypothetical protein
MRVEWLREACAQLIALELGLDLPLSNARVVSNAVMGGELEAEPSDLDFASSVLLLIAAYAAPFALTQLPLATTEIEMII